MGQGCTPHTPHLHKAISFLNQKQDGKAPRAGGLLQLAETSRQLRETGVCWRSAAGGQASRSGFGRSSGTSLPEGFNGKRKCV